MAEIAIRHLPERSRFQLVDGEEVIGTAYYRSEQGRRLFTHTEVDEDRQGQGLASRLIRFALDETVGEGLRIVPLCPAVASYVGKHPNYDEAIDPS